VIAKVEWHPGELYPRVGFIVTNMSRPAPFAKVIGFKLYAAIACALTAWGSEEVIAAYHLHAAHCTKIAERTSDLKNRLILLLMAVAWLTRVEQAEKNSLVYKAPEPIQAATAAATTPELTLLESNQVC
jgi:hypothetical protein